MDLRDGVLILGVVLLLAFFADLARRLVTRNRLKLKIDKRFQGLPDTDLSAELPGGGKARIVKQGEQPSAASEIKEPTFDLSGDDADMLSKDDSRSSRREPHLGAAGDGDLDLLLADEFKGVGEARTLLAEGDSVKAREPVTAPVVIPSAESETSSAVADDLDGTTALATATVERLQTEGEAEPRLVDESPVVIDTPSAHPLQRDEPPVSVAPNGGDAVLVDGDAEDTHSPELSAQDSHLTLADTPAPVDLMRPVAEILEDAQRHESDDSSAEESVADEQGQRAVEVAATTRSETSQYQAPTADVAPVERPAASSIAADHPDNESAVAPAVPPKPSRRARKGRPEVQASFFDLDPELAPEPEVDNSRRKSKKSADAKEPVDEVLVITVKARHDPFVGKVLFRLVEACGMTWGEQMKIYHRHEDGDGVGKVQFSMVNLVQPGTFEPADSEGFSTPGVSLFLNMSEPSRLMEAFDCMLATAQCLADNLDGELRDDQRSSLRGQTIEHYRNKVRDYERRRLTRRA